MSRDYMPVKGKNMKFAKVASFNVNISGVHEYGRLFDALGLPVDRRTIEGNSYPSLPHEFKGPDFERIKAAVMRPEFPNLLLEALTKSGDVFPGEVEHLMNHFFKWFLDSRYVAVASDYCEEYC
jgi:hypothetical protein